MATLTSEDWFLGRRPTGRDFGYRWVDPDRENRTKEEWPYSYSDHYLWGSKEGSTDAVYSDRLHQWDDEKYKRSVKVAGVSGRHIRDWGRERTSDFLTAYFGKPTEALGLAEGCNVSNGYPYWIFFFRNGTAMTKAQIKKLETIIGKLEALQASLAGKAAGDGWNSRLSR